MNVLIEISLQSSACILLLVILRPLMKKAISARQRYALWLIPLLRLVLPISVSSPLSVWNHTQVRSRVGGLTPTTVDISSQVSPYQGVIDSPMTTASQTVAPGVALPPTAMNPAFDWQTILPRIAFWIWAIGAVAMLFVFVVNNYRFYRMIRPKMVSMSFPYPLPICLVESLSSPCLVGVLRPKILLNGATLRSDNTLDMVLLHELTHWSRGDHVWSTIRAAIVCLWWWNPLVWLAARLSRQDGELACDEAVMRDMSTTERKMYGMSLIELMRWDGEGVPQLKMGASMRGGKKEMEERIKMIALKCKRPGLIGFCFIMCFALLIPLIFTSASAMTISPKISIGDLPEIPIPNGPLSQEESIELAKVFVLGNIVYDYGIDRFEVVEVISDSLEWEGESLPVDIVKLRAIDHNNKGNSLSVYIHKDLGRVLYIESSDMTWRDASFSPKPIMDLARPAYICHPDAPAVSLMISKYPGDYGYAKEQLFNGTPVIINQIYNPVENFYTGTPEDLRGEWAFVTIGSNEFFAGSQGYMPMKFLALADSFEEDNDSWFEGILQAEDSKYISIMADTGLTDKILASFPVGTEVRILGQTIAYYHVNVGSVVGFVPLSALAVDERTAQRLSSAQPLDYEEVQPGWEKLYEEYEFKQSILYNRYGDVNSWTLAQLTEGSQLALAYGFTWVENKVKILPGTDDLTEEEAVALARVQAKELFGFELEDVKEIWPSYFYQSGSEQAKTWEISFFVKGSEKDYKIVLDQQGELIDSWKGD